MPICRTEKGYRWIASDPPLGFPGPERFEAFALEGLQGILQTSLRRGVEFKGIKNYNTFGGASFGIERMV